MGRNVPEVAKYEGGNETIDRLLAEHWPDETLWHVNGVYGRKPVTADTREEALRIYEEKFKPRDDEEDLLVQSA